MPESEDRAREILEAAARDAKALGLEVEWNVGEEQRETIPPVNLTAATSDVAWQTGQNLRGAGLYRFGNRLVTVNEEGEPEDMTTDCFRTWIDKFQLNYYKKRKAEDGEDGVPIKATMRKDQASTLLASRDFLEALPKLEAIMPVRVPVFEEEGVTVRLLPEGYDKERKVLTVGTGVKVEEDWDLEKATEYLRTLLGEFPFAEEEQEGRSMAVQVAAMLTPFCNLLLPELVTIPMVYYNANAAGSGKSRLAELAIYPVYGAAGTVNYMDGHDGRFLEELNTWALKKMAYCFIDDVTGLINSNVLNKWLTQPTWSGRLMQTQRSFQVSKRGITLLTGNQATLSADLARRSLICDLWASELPGDRSQRLSRTIDHAWMIDPENRSDILSALWALVREWAAAGSIRHERTLPSFEGWSWIVPAIVKAAGFGCPLSTPQIADAGGKQEVEFQRMLQAAARIHKLGEHPETQEIALKLPEWCAVCRARGLFHSTLGDLEQWRQHLEEKPALYDYPRQEDGTTRPLTDDDKDRQALAYMDRSTATKFSKLLHKHYRGAIRVLEDGRKVQFGHRESRHSSFTLTVVEEAEE